MYKKPLQITLLLCLIISANAQEIPEKVKTLLELNQKVVQEYKKGDFKDALKFGEQSLALTIEIYGENEKETAFVYANIGEIYMARKKYSDAAEHFRQSVVILESLKGNNETSIIAHTSRLGTALALDGKETEARSILENTLLSAEEKYGKQSKQIIPYLRTLTDFYVFSKEYNEVEENFVRLYLLSREYFGEENDELEKIIDKFRCYTTRSFYRKEEGDYSEKFYDVIRTEQDKIFQDGILNGKAVSIAAPKYPSQARRASAGGIYGIKVEVDKTGKVINAESICGGYKYLEETSVEAAYKAKFSPRTLNNKPVKVRGLLIYRYIP